MRIAFIYKQMSKSYIVRCGALNSFIAIIYVPELDKAEITKINIIIKTTQTKLREVLDTFNALLRIVEFPQFLCQNFPIKRAVSHTSL